MRPTVLPSCRPSLGLAAAWLLGLVAVLGTVTATLARVLRPPNGSDAGAPAVVVAPPERFVPIHRGRVSRTDTLPHLLSVSHAVEIDSGWVVLDARARRVHVLSDRAGEPGASFGREGDGPGELRLPYRLAVSGPQVGILESSGDRLVRFALDGAPLGPVRLSHPTCPFGPAQALLTAPGGGFLILRRCTRPDGSSRALLLRVDPEGRAEPLAERILPSVGDRNVHPWASPVATVLGATTYLGTLADGCLVPVRSAPDGSAPETLCVPTDPVVPLSDSTRAALETLGRRVERLGGSLAIPDRLPAFIGLRTSAAGVVLEIPLPDGGTALDLLHEGARRSRFLTDSARGTFVGRRHLLLVRDLVEGTELAWVPRNG